METGYGFRMPETLIYGAGVFQQTGATAARYGKRALLVSDPIMEGLGWVQRCRELLEDAGVGTTVFAGIETEPTDRYVSEGIRLCREHRGDVVVAVGGGSCLDTAKAIAVMMTNPGELRDYAGRKRSFVISPLPLVAVPTTAGTGSEVTRVTVITDTERDVKMMLAHPELLPRAAIVDPELMVSCPPKVTAATGIDALCHAVEAFLSRRAHPLTDTLALKAAALMHRYLPEAYAHGENRTAREQTAIGAMMAGAAFSNASVALVHGMSRPIGALFHVPHGISNAMLFPAVLEFTKPFAIPRLAELGRVLAPDRQELNDEAMAENVIAEIKRLCRWMDIPNLKGWGIDKERYVALLPKMASDALASGSPQNNPRVPTKDEIMALYEACYDYDFA